MTTPARHALASTARLLVVKVGTRVLTGPDGRLDDTRLASLGRQVDAVLGQDRQVVLVSSGAVGAGLGRMGLERRPQELAHLQAVAAIGQSRLIESWQRALGGHRRHVAQVLLVADDMQNRSRYLNIRNTLRAVLEYGAVPVINENDTVSVEELRTSFGDNDRLAALVTTLLAAPLLVLLSDVEGLYDRHPSDAGASIVPHVATIDAPVEALARDRPGGFSKGGMASKIAAARIATEAGASCIIASGRDDQVLEKICRGESVGTLFSGRATAMPAWKRWLAWSADGRGTVMVDTGAREAVVGRGRSLLAAGVIGVEGHFAAGDVVAIQCHAGEVFARGLVNYSADELRRIAGARTERIAELLGCCPYEEVVHRDNLAVLSRDRGRDTGLTPA